MVKIKKASTKKLTIVSNQVVRDDSLTWKARGIFVYLWSQSENWCFYEKEVAKHSADGISSLRAGIKELENRGYITRTRERVNGKLATPVWILSEEPKCEKPQVEKPQVEKPNLEKPNLEKPILENRTLRNTNLKKQQLEETTIKSNIGSANAEQSKTRMQKNILDKAEPSVYKKVIDYLNSKIGSKYKPNSAVNKRLVDARAKEGYSIDDFKRVIDNKYATWAFDSKMRKYLRPQTLFGTKFESYLNEKPANVPAHTDFNVLKDDTIENIPDDELPF